MPDKPGFGPRNSSTPGSARFRWRVFARFLAVFAAISTITVATMLFAQKMLSPATASATGLALELALSAGAAWLFTQWLSHRAQVLLRGIDASLSGREQEAPVDLADELFGEVIPSWQGVLKGLHETRREKQEEARQIYETLTELMRMIAKAVDERTIYLRGHSERVAAYAASIAWKLGLEQAQVERIRLSALLHDIGCMGVEDYLVMKQTPLTAEEFEILKAHTVKGAAILRPIAMLSDLVPGVELHHESLDGLGYPYGLVGDQIPLMARIIAVADSFDAMTTPRPYQAAMNPDYVLDILRRLAGARYDPAVVEALGELVSSGALEVKDVRTPVSFRMRKPAVAELV
ncbi:MAG TPA: HD-GYP domain-containing protein [Acidobacteriaceae bacterium]|nr:HD-GYP domain-containing protein [Acidobacteriaceae bacterium]